MGRSPQMILVFVFAALITKVKPLRAQDVDQIDAINAKLAHIIDSNAKPPEVQIATLPAIVDWGDTGGKYAFYSLCDDLPKWGPTIRATGNTVSGRYFQFLMGIKAPNSDPMADVQQRQAATKAHQFADQLTKDQDNMRDGWYTLSDKEARLPLEERTSFALYKRQHGNLIASDEISYRSALGTWQKSAAAAAPSGVGKALNDLMLSDETNVMTYSGVADSAYPCIPLTGLPKLLSDAKAHTGAPDLNLKFTHHTARKDESWDSWGGSAGWGPFSVSAHHERHDVHTQDSNFSLSLVASAIVRTDLKRPWLDYNLISTYRNSDMYADSEIKKNLPLFGENGSFALVSQTFVLAYHPKITLTMGATDYKLFHDAFTGGGSVSIGPFHAGGSGTGGVNVESWDETSHTVVIGTSAESFVLIGVINKVMP